MKKLENENKEMDEIYIKEIDELQVRRRDLVNDLKLKQLIISNFIPDKEFDRLTQIAIYNEVKIMLIK